MVSPSNQNLENINSTVPSYSFFYNIISVVPSYSSYLVIVGLKICLHPCIPFSTRLFPLSLFCIYDTPTTVVLPLSTISFSVFPRLRAKNIKIPVISIHMFFHHTPLWGAWLNLVSPAPSHANHPWSSGSTCRHSLPEPLSSHPGDQTEVEVPQRLPSVTLLCLHNGLKTQQWCRQLGCAYCACYLLWDKREGAWHWVTTACHPPTFLSSRAVSSRLSTGRVSTGQ